MGASKGNNYVFYYPDGVTTAEDTHEFIDFYSKAYYFRVKDKDLEGRVEDIFNSTKKLTPQNVIDILCWKTGGSPHKVGKKTTMRIPRRRCHINANEVYDCVKGIERGRYVNPGSDSDSSFKELIKNMITPGSEFKIDGFGIVYALTVAYFLSNGRYPIYDKYADLAGFAISENIKPARVIKYKDISSNFELAYDRYQKYYEELKSIFGEEGYSKREVDQALWTYGHLFEYARDKTPKKEMVKMKVQSLYNSRKQKDFI